MKSSAEKKILSLMLSFFLIIFSLPVVCFADTTIDNLTNRYDELEKELESIQKQLDATQSEKKQQQTIRNNLTKQITTTQNQISILAEKIDYLENELESKRILIEELEAEVIQQQEYFMQRIRSIYKAEVASSFLGMVFGSDSLSTYLSYGKYLSCISTHDTELLESLSENIETLKQLRIDMQEEEAELVSTKATAETKKNNLSSQRSAVDSTLQDISAREKEFLANLEESQQIMAQVQADIDAIYRNTSGSGSSVDYSKTGFIYPIKGRTSISSYFGWRFNGTDYHTGIDFPAPKNTPIRASVSGTVTYVRTGAPNNTKSWGYGNYIIIDHGGGYSTLYGHCNSVAVSVGQTVSKGDTIGYVGTTGWSTGYHLHFEIRVNGKAVNPLNYL